MASVDKRPNGMWRARWREYPGGPQRTKAFPRKVDAERHLVQVVADLSSAQLLVLDQTCGYGVHHRPHLVHAQQNGGAGSEPGVVSGAVIVAVAQAVDQVKNDVLVAVNDDYSMLGVFEGHCAAFRGARFALLGELTREQDHDLPLKPIADSQWNWHVEREAALGEPVKDILGQRHTNHRAPCTAVRDDRRRPDRHIKRDVSGSMTRLVIGHHRESAIVAVASVGHSATPSAACAGARAASITVRATSSSAGMRWA